MTKWFSMDNTEGFDEKTLKEMNDEMDKVFANLDEEERENKSYLDYLQERILSKRQETMKEFLEGCKTAKEAKEKATWAAKVVKVEGGYMAFEFMTDYTTWINQK